MSNKDKRKVRALLIVLAVAIVIVGLSHAISVHMFNSEVHTVVGHEPTDDVSMDIHFRGDATSRWEKIDMGIYGNIWDATFQNDSRNIINGWTLTINIHGDCYLNQYWNGDVEIHQRGKDGQMHVQRLNLATYDVNSLEIDYLYDGSDLMIPLREGDSFVYYPTEKFKETTVHPDGDIVTGFIIYYADDFDLSDYHVDFNFHKRYQEGWAYGVLFLLIVAFFLVAGMGIFWRVIYRRAQKEMDLRLSGLSSMSDIYVTIYIIDLVEQTITPVGLTEEEDRFRPKDKSVNEQMLYFAEFDADEDYQSLMKDFVNLETLAERMENRNTLAFEYHGKYFGWCCIRFMAMDRQEGMPVTKVLFTVQDINQEKKELDDIYEQVEEAKSESSAKSAFLANMSHEIRTPINTVIGLDTMILRESKNEVVRGYAKQIKTASSMLLSLINSILDFSKLEAGKMELMPGEYSLTSLVRDLQIIIKARAQEKNLDLKIDVTESIPDKLYGDDVRLKQVILNLLTNAVKYTEQGSVRLGIYGKQVEGDQVHLLISVKDTGSGIKEENKEALFQRFARIEEDKNRKIEGTGIGMSLVNGLLELMDSELKVATIYGRGSDFYFEIDQKVMGEKPVGKVDWSTITLDDEDEEGYAASFTAPQAHVLVVDDNDMNLMVFKNLVKETQIQVDTATSGKKALEMTKEKSYHLIFMDHMMPQMSGIEAMQLIKEQQDGQNQKTPIIILTANALQGAKDEYEKMGFADFMAKPIKPEILEEKILAHLPKKLTKAAPSRAKKAVTETHRTVLPEISGVDTAYAIEHMGSADAVAKIMNQFASVGKADEEELRSYYEALSADPEDKEALQSYRIKVHAMKTSASLCGALQVYGVAAWLEKFAAEQKVEQILSMTPDFLAFWHQLYEALKAYAEQMNPQKKEKGLLNQEMLNHQLRQLIVSMNSYDIKGADVIVKELDQYELSAEVEGKIQEIKTAVAQMDAEKCEQLCKEIMK